MVENGQILRRLKQFMELKGLNNNQVTEIAGLSNGQIGKAFKRNKGLNQITIEKLLHAFPDLDRSWFLNGDNHVRPHVRPDVRPDINTGNNSVVNEPGASYKTRDQLEAENKKLKAANLALIEALKAISE